MTDNEIKNLYSYFKTRESIEEEAVIWAKVNEGELDADTAYETVGKMRYAFFLEGLKAYQIDTNKWPMKVPVYKRNILTVED